MQNESFIFDIHILLPKYLFWLQMEYLAVLFLNVSHYQGLFVVFDNQ